MTKPSVLLVEDDAWFAEQQVRVLSGAGFSVRHAADGLAAIEAIDESVPDVIVLDVFLPGPNGLALLHEMQSYTDLGVIPVVVCTSSAADVPADGLGPYGVRRMVDKCTMQPNDLVAAVKAVLS
jgi:CheY-like chemotaxis protein